MGMPRASFIMMCKNSHNIIQEYESGTKNSSGLKCQNVYEKQSKANFSKVLSGVLYTNSTVQKYLLSNTMVMKQKITLLSILKSIQQDVKKTTSPLLINAYYRIPDEVSAVPTLPTRLLLWGTPVKTVTWCLVAEVPDDF